MVGANFFNKLNKKIISIKIKWKIFKELKPGDIVWAKMPLSKRKMKNIEKAHQIRPYLIVEKNKFFVYAFQSSSKKWKKAYNYEEYRINSLRYGMNKDSFISLKSINKIFFTNLNKRYVRLINYDIKNIQKRLKILNSKIHYNIDFDIKDGDIIEIENQIYYVYSSDNVYLYCLEFFTKKPSNKYEIIKINHRNYYTKFHKKFTFKRKDKIQLKNLASNEEISKILKKIKESKIKRKNKNIL